MVGKLWTFIIITVVTLTLGIAIGWHVPHGAVYFTPGSACENRIITEIGAAHKIDIAVYSITNPKITDAIISAHLRGAKIRIITDRTMSQHPSSHIRNLSAIGITIQTNHGHKIEHNKFAVFDNRRIVTGSYNWTHNASAHNSENCIFLDIMTTEYTKRFDYLWQIYDQYVLFTIC